MRTTKRPHPVTSKEWGGNAIRWDRKQIGGGVGGEERRGGVKAGQGGRGAGGERGEAGREGRGDGEGKPGAG